MDNALDDLQEIPVCNSISDAENVIASNEEWKTGPLQEASTQYESLNALVQQMADLGSTENPYTTLTPEVRERALIQDWMRFFLLLFCRACMRNGVVYLILSQFMMEL